MLRTFQFRLQPNANQTAMLERILTDNCDGRDHNAGINIKQLALSSLGMSDVVVQAESVRAYIEKLRIQIPNVPILLDQKNGHTVKKEK